NAMSRPLRPISFPPACASFRLASPTVSMFSPRSRGSSLKRLRGRWRRRSRKPVARRCAPISPACITRRNIRDCFDHDRFFAFPAPGGGPGMRSRDGPVRVGVGGPVGSGKTALMDALCKELRSRYEIAAITNDIYTKWDAEYLVRSGALPPDRIAGVETGGC